MPAPCPLARERDRSRASCAHRSHPIAPASRRDRRRPRGLRRSTRERASRSIRASHRPRRISGHASAAATRASFNVTDPLNESALRTGMPSEAEPRTAAGTVNSSSTGPSSSNRPSSMRPAVSRATARAERAGSAVREAGVQVRNVRDAQTCRSPPAPEAALPSVPLSAPLRVSLPPGSRHSVDPTDEAPAADAASDLQRRRELHSFKRLRRRLQFEPRLRRLPARW